MIFLNCWPEPSRAKIELMTCKNLTKTREISDLWSSQSEVVRGGGVVDWIMCWILTESCDYEYLLYYIHDLNETSAKLLRMNEACL